MKRKAFGRPEGGAVRLAERYGVSWQIVPTVLDKMLQDRDRRKVAQVTEAFLK